MKRIVVYGSLAALLVLAAPVQANDPAPSKAAGKYEIDFLTGMIDHHQMAVMTGEMCIDKAVHEELASFCKDIVRAQSQEIALMQSWLEAWYGVSHEPQMSARDERMMEHFASLEGTQFEVEFMEMMVKHHASAVRGGEACLKRAYHGELVDLCRNIIDTQTAEIEQLQTWLCEWYARCD